MVMAGFLLLQMLLVLLAKCKMAAALPTKMELYPGNVQEVVNLVRSINDLSRRLTFELREKNSNIVLSPLSIGSVLGMMWIGAAGETRNEIQRICGFRPNENVEEEFSALHTGFLSPIGVIEKEQSGVISANGIFYDQAQRLRNEFWGRLQNFRAEARVVNFKFDSESARATINSWVKNKTRGMIEDILPPKSVNSKTRAVIMNAVYFSGTWKFPFHTYKTTMRTFTTITGNEIQVPMLTRESKLAYKKVCNEKERLTLFKRVCTNVIQPDVVEIPYATGNYVMIILAPNERFSFSQIEARMKRGYRRWRHGAFFGDVDLSIPKFHMNFQTDLKPALQRIGLKTTFSSGANFDNMSDGKIVFEKFIHKSSIIVDETGSRASASSAAVSVLKGASNGRISFSVDKPFFFFIEDRITGVQLFSGRITDPTQANVSM